VKGEGWWQSLTNQEPESSITKKGGERAEIGTWEGLTLVFQFQPLDNRVDWVASESPVGRLENPPLPLVEKLAAFTRLANRWLTSPLCPQPTVRLAFGLVVDLPVVDWQAGYRRLADYLPFDPDPTTSSDFRYQINRQRDSVSVPGTRIHRLMQWSVGLLLRQRLQLIETTLTATPEQDQVRCGCRLELDINTAPQTGKTIPQDRLSPLFGEMVGLAEEIIREGDIP
jgi:hypothetical protein